MVMKRIRWFHLLLLTGLILTPALLTTPERVTAASCFDQDLGCMAPVGYDSAQALSPTRSMRLGIISGANAFGFSGIQQMLTIPAAATSATLTWSAWPFLATSGEDDYQEVILQDAATSSTVVVLWRDQRNDRAWVPLTRDVLAYKGQNLRQLRRHVSGRCLPGGLPGRYAHAWPRRGR